MIAMVRISHLPWCAAASPSAAIDRTSRVPNTPDSLIGEDCEESLALWDRWGAPLFLAPAKGRSLEHLALGCADREVIAINQAHGGDLGTDSREPVGLILVHARPQGRDHLSARGINHYAQGSHHVLAFGRGG